MKEEGYVEVDVELDVRFVNETSCRKDLSLCVVEHVAVLQRDNKSVENDEDEKGVSQRLCENKHEGLSLNDQIYRRKADLRW